ncbi:MAG: HD domain-containing phosphohydrolase, partial [bacterium]
VERGVAEGKLSNRKLKVCMGIAEAVVKSGRPIITPTIKKNNNIEISKTEINISPNVLCVPLKFEDDTVGVVELLNKNDGKGFIENHIAIISAYTNNIAIIIKNAQFVTENKNRIHRLEHLMELTEYVNSTFNIATLFEMILSISKDTLGSEAGAIKILDEDKQIIKVAAASGLMFEKLIGIKVPAGEGISGWVVRENKSVMVKDAQNDPRLHGNKVRIYNLKTKTVLAVPLRTKNNLIGVMEVINKKNNEYFTNEDMHMLEALANQAAIAIENARLYANVKDLFVNTIASLAAAIETKDVYTRGHSKRVTMFAELIAKELDFNEEETENLNLAGTLHDIGKIGVDESILQKPAKLTDAEFVEIMKHPEYAANILEAIPQLRHIIPAIRFHHERFDGKGYPAKLKGQNIPYFSRILAIADAFDAMSSSRPYRVELPFEKCIDELKKHSGTQFDPELTAVAIKAFKKWHDINNKTQRRNNNDSMVS